MERRFKKILLLERDEVLGGILNQCIHNGFGLHHFKEELTGPEYSERYIKAIKDTDIEISLESMVEEITKDKIVKYISPKGYFTVKAKTIILAMGCRERTRGAIMLPGSRPAGIYTAGAAQRLINIDGWLDGKKS